MVGQKSGENLRRDSRDWGRLFVARAMKDLIKELKSRPVQESQTDLQPLAAKRYAGKISPKTSNQLRVSVRARVLSASGGRLGRHPPTWFTKLFLDFRAAFRSLAPGRLWRDEL